MRSLFTVHAGEYVVASEIERRFRRTNVWVPSRDTGVDLLVTDRRSRGALSLQVKFSKDFLATHMEPAFQKQLRACGWWTIDEASSPSRRRTIGSSCYRALPTEPSISSSCRHAN